jgi:hypothetical protein
MFDPFNAFEADGYLRNFARYKKDSGKIERSGNVRFVANIDPAPFAAARLRLLKAKSPEFPPATQRTPELCRMRSA